MYCNQCGANNPDGSRFCNGCGNKLMMPASAVSQASPALDKPVVPVSQVELTRGPVEKLNFATNSAPVNPAEVRSVDDKLRSLSVYSEKEVVTADGKTRPALASADLNPIEDPYWDDILPEIEAEIMAIPKENIIKAAGCLIALFAVMAWLIYML